jgi:hypothetical protein
LWAWLAHSPWAADAGPLERGAVLRVAWQDPTGCARGLEPIALAEVARLLGRMGVGVQWRLDSCFDPEVPGEVRVVLLDRARPAAGRLVLGASPAVRGARPVAWVHLPSVRRGLGDHLEWQSWRFDQRERRTLGIAIGRVAAHEIVHAVAPEVPHGQGLMSARLDRDLLTGPPPRLDREVALAVRRALAAGRGAQPAVATLERGTAAALAHGPD